MITKDLQERIRIELFRRRLSYRKVGLKLGYSSAYICMMLSGKKPMTEKFRAYLGVLLTEDLFEEKKSA